MGNTRITLWLLVKKILKIQYQIVTAWVDLHVFLLNTRKCNLKLDNFIVLEAVLLLKPKQNKVDVCIHGCMYL